MCNMIIMLVADERWHRLSCCAYEQNFAHVQVIEAGTVSGTLRLQ